MSHTLASPYPETAWRIDDCTAAEFLFRSTHSYRLRRANKPSSSLRHVQGPVVAHTRTAIGSITVIRRYQRLIAATC